MRVDWIIEKKRDGAELSSEEIQFLIDGYTRGDIPDYQMSALCMAIYFQGMNFSETSTLTQAMMNSGHVLDTSSIPVPKVDKHSTGGIGDKVSLILAPLAACFDVAVPMISGRGLGITGGTLDKLESIPGFRVDLSEEEFFQVIQKCGFAMIGQTKSIAPADKKLYALRDVTATVPSIPLITSSIMSKKMAEGIDALVLDVKVGCGAFMKEISEARKLAEFMVEVGKNMNKKVRALITDMSEPLGRSVGNAVEVQESLDILSGSGEQKLRDLCVLLVSHMLELTEIYESAEAATDPILNKLQSGEAYAKFEEMVTLQGGSLEEFNLKYSETSKIAFEAPESGYVQSVDAEGVGRAAILLGAGRQKVEDDVNHAVGISELKKSGEFVEKGEALCQIHFDSKQDLVQAQLKLSEAFVIDSKAAESKALLLETCI